MENRRKRGFAAFTLPDLCATLAVTALIVGVAMPYGRQITARASCQENLRHIGLAFQLYAADHLDQLPGCQHTPPSWTESLLDYGARESLVCAKRIPAADRSLSYALNDFLTSKPYGARKLEYVKIAAIPAPGETVLFAEGTTSYMLLKFDHFHFADARENGFTPARFSRQVDVLRHGPSANYLFPDGHVEAVSWNDAQGKLGTSRFVHPQGTAPDEQLIVFR